jgi:hypothetical protein
MDNPQRLTPAEVALARKRRLTAMHLQEIEGNPLTADQVAMFEMFEREAWTHEQCRAYILAKVRHLAAEGAKTDEHDTTGVGGQKFMGMFSWPKYSGLARAKPAPADHHWSTNNHSDDAGRRQGGGRRGFSG